MLLYKVELAFEFTRHHDAHRQAACASHAQPRTRIAPASLGVQPRSRADHLTHMHGACRCIFDIDGIDLGPERRAYLEHGAERVWEVNAQGSIPYVPYLRAPYYVWIGRKPTSGHAPHEARAEAPALFPPTFLYSQSWEDPAPDMKVFNINDKDVCLTLTSGGCNSLNLVRRSLSRSCSALCVWQ